MFAKIFPVLTVVFLVSFCCRALVSPALATDRSPGAYLPPDRVQKEYRHVKRTPLYPRTQSRETDQYRPHPITNAGESWEDNHHYYLSREDERYLMKAMQGKLSIPTIKLPSGLVVTLVFIRTPTGSVDPVTKDPLYHTRYKPAKTVKVLP